jgi:hypothetical protein
MRTGVWIGVAVDLRVFNALVLGVGPEEFNRVDPDSDSLGAEGGSRCRSKQQRGCAKQVCCTHFRDMGECVSGEAGLLQSSRTEGSVTRCGPLFHHVPRQAMDLSRQQKGFNRR